MQAKTLLESFRYPRLGPGMMWDAARDRIVESGQGQVLMGHALKQLASDGQGGWRIAHPKLAAQHRLNAGIIVDSPMLAVRFRNGRKLGMLDEFFAAFLA